MNTICLTGNVCKNYEPSRSASGLSIVKNQIAVRDTAKNKEGGYDTFFFNFVVFGAKADYLIDYGKMGDKIEINGKLTMRKYIDNNNNQKTIYEIIVNEVAILKSREEKTTNEQIIDADLPF